MYKALITDLDGTVTAIGTDGSDISAQTKAAVQEAHAKGKKITCATGRGWTSSKPVVKHLGLVDPCIIEGGSCIINPQTEEIIWEMSLDDKESKAVLGILKDAAANHGSIKSTSNTERIELSQTDNIDGPNRVIYLLRVNAETAEKVEHAINQTSFAVAHKTTPSWYGPEFTDVHITHPEGTKQHVIAQWQKMMSITKDETVGLGDGENDIPIFQSVGWKVAVANAHQNLKQRADQVVAAYDQGGLDEVINTVLLG